MKRVSPEKTVQAVIAILTDARKEQGLSHEALAQATGLSRPAISFIEAGKRQPTLLTCAKMADALKVDLGTALLIAQGKR